MKKKKEKKKGKMINECENKNEYRINDKIEKW